MRKRPSAADARLVGLILFDGVTLMDVAGPAEVFAAASATVAPAPGYLLQTYAAGGEPVRSESGVMLVPDAALPQQLKVDTLLIPGGSGLRQPQVLRKVADVLVASRPYCRRLISVCTGAYALSESGLAAGRRVATHWRFAEDLATRYPDVAVDARSLFLMSDGIGSSAGVTAGIDLCLALVEADLGHAVALAAARELVVYMRRSGGQAQYSEPLKLQSGPNDRVGELISAILVHPGADLRLESLAARIHLSPRQLQRLIRQRYGCGVSALVTKVRMQEAQRLLGGRQSIAVIASCCGYFDVDSFSRAFLQHTGLRPTEWRARFAEDPTDAVNPDHSQETKRQ